MTKIKKLISVALSVLLMMSLMIPALAHPLQENMITDSEATTRKTAILSETVPQDVIRYAMEQYLKHIRAVCRDYSDDTLSIEYMSEYILGEPFALYHNDSTYDIFYFPVLLHQRVAGILTITVVDDEIYSSFSKGFAENLNLLHIAHAGEFIITQSNSDLVAISAKETVLLCEEFDSSASVAVADFQNIIQSGVFEKVFATEAISDAETATYLMRSDPGAPLDYESLPITLIRQTQSNWCWAASCSMIINYLTGANVTMEDVVTYVKGSLVDQTGSWNEMRTAYNHWGLSPMQGSPLSYSEVKWLIDSGEPVHIGVYSGDDKGHSIVIKGYERYSTDSYYVANDPGERSPVSIRVQPNAADICYSSSVGTLRYWRYSRYAF